MVQPTPMALFIAVFQIDILPLFEDFRYSSEAILNVWPLALIKYEVAVVSMRQVRFTSAKQTTVNVSAYFFVVES
jgi:hypothetical protein